MAHVYKQGGALPIAENSKSQWHTKQGTTKAKGKLDTVMLSCGAIDTEAP